jgi:hypothetical protein
MGGCWAEAADEAASAAVDAVRSSVKRVMNNSPWSMDRNLFSYPSNMV